MIPRMLLINNKELCFKIENNDLYLEEVLIEFEGISILFLCKSEEQFYLALCTDIDCLSYIVVKLSSLDMYELLHGKITMRDSILKQQEFWNIISSDNIDDDKIERNSIDKIDLLLLPKEDAFFEPTTIKLKKYINNLEK